MPLWDLPVVESQHCSIFLGYWTIRQEGNITSMEQKFPSTQSHSVPARKGVIGFVFQSFNLIDELNVYEILKLPLLYIGYLRLPNVKREWRTAMERMAINTSQQTLPATTFRRQQQRVAIARAVVTNPKLILADEPTGNLDSKNGAEVMNLLTELNKEGTTIIMVTHSQHDASFAHRTVHLFDGSVVASVTA